MEGSVITLRPDLGNLEGLDETKLRTEFFSSLSDDKRQDGNTVYENIKFILNDLFDRQLIRRTTLRVIMDIVDGCAVQYRSGTVSFFRDTYACQ